MIDKKVKYSIKKNNKKGGQKKIGMIECDRKKFMAMKRELKESRKRYQELIDNVNDAIYYIDSKGKVISASPSIEQILGYTAKELAGRYIFDLVHPDDLVRTREKARKVLTGKSEPFETRVIRKDGSIGYVRSFGRLMPNGNKKEKRIVSILTDITDQKKAENALREREEQFRDIYENAPFGIFHSTKEGKMLRVNPAYANMLKYDSPQELIENVNKTDIAKCLFVNPKKRVSIVSEVMKIPGWHKFENDYFCKDGKIIKTIVLLRKIVNPVTKGEEMEGFMEDITERKEAETKLIESYKYLGTINRQVSVLLELNKILDEKNRKEIADFIIWSALEISSSKFAALYEYQPERRNKKLRLVSLASTIGLEKQEKDRIEYLPLENIECFNDFREEKIEEAEKCLGSTNLEEVKTKYKISNFYVLSIMKKETLEGILVLGFSAKREVSEQEKGLYDVFAKYATFILLETDVLGNGRLK